MDDKSSLIHLAAELKSMADRILDHCKESEDCEESEESEDRDDSAKDPVMLGKLLAIKMSKK